MVQSTPAATLENLSRLASKPGVQSTLILSKSDGSIIRSTGLLADPNSRKPSVNDPSVQIRSEEHTNGPASGEEYTGERGAESEDNSAESVARLVFSFVASAKTFTQGMDGSDDVKLLRLRTRKNEIVIVPDPKFLLVVIHDTPPA